MAAINLANPMQQNPLQQNQQPIDYVEAAKEFGGAVDYLEAAKEFGGTTEDVIIQDGVNRTPIDLPETGSEIDPYGFYQPGGLYSENLKSAAAKGVEFTKESPMNMTFSGFAFDDEQISSYAAKELGTKTRIGEDTGRVEYLDKETNRWTTLKPEGFSGADFEGFVGEATVLAPEMGLGVLGTLGGPAVAALGSVGGAMIGEAARLSIGYYSYDMGKDSMTEDEFIERASRSVHSVGAFAAGGIVAGGVARKLVKNLSNFIKNNWLPEGSEQLLEDKSTVIQESYKVIDDINQQIGGGYKPTAGEIAKSNQMLSTQSALRQQDETMGAFEGRQEENTAALGRYFDKTTGFEGGDPKQALTETGEKIQKQSKTLVDESKARREGFVERAEERSAAARDAIAAQSMNVDQSMAKVREAVEGNMAKFKTWADAEYGELDKLANGVEISNNKTQSVANSIRSELKVAQGLFRGAGKKEEAYIGPKYVLDEEGEAILQKLYDPDATFSFKEAQLGISYLKSQVRALQSAQGVEPKTIAAVKRLQQALVEDRAEAAKRVPGLTESLARIEDAYRAKKNLYYRGQVGRFMKKGSNGQYEISDEKAFQKFLLSDNPDSISDTNAKAFRDAINGEGYNTEGMKSVQGAFMKAYRSKVYDDDGKFIRANHNAFIKNQKSAYQYFFTPQDMRIIETSGTMGEAFDRIAKRRDILNAELDKTTKGVLSRMEDGQKIRTHVGIGNVTAAGVSKLDAFRIKKIGKILRRDQETWQGLQQNILADMKKSVFSGRGENAVLNPDRFASYLKENSKVIKDVFGDEVLSSMETLYKAAEISTRSHKFTNVSKTAPSLAKLMRMAVLGPLSHTGFVLGGVQARWRHEKAMRANKVIGDALLDVDFMKELASLSKAKASSKRAAIVLGGAVGAYYGGGDNFPSHKLYFDSSGLEAAP